MEFNLDISLEFVEKINSESTFAEYITGQAGTGDSLFLIIFAAIAVLCISLGAFILVKKKNLHFNEGRITNHVLLKSKTSTSIRLTALVFVAILIIVSSLFICNFVKAQAGAETLIETPSTVKANKDNNIKLINKFCLNLIYKLYKIKAPFGAFIYLTSFMTSEAKSSTLFSMPSPTW